MKFGNSSWELDALEPTAISLLVQTHVEALRDNEAWEEMLKKEEEYKERLYKTAEKFKE